MEGGAGAAKGMGHYRRVGWGVGKGFVSQGGGREMNGL